MAFHRAILLALYLAIPAWAADLPSGPMPEIDGRIDANEWDPAYRMPVPHGTAHLRTSGRVLCIGIEVQRPYAGERIDLRTATPDGERLTLLQVHPAGYIPRPPYSALPPVVIRRSTWKERADAKYAKPYSIRARSRILQKDAKSWSCEFCVALETLDLPIGKPAVFLLTISNPFSGENRPLTTPPAKWEPLKARWDPQADLFMTPKEDEIHAWALELFAEGLDRARNVEPNTPILGAAFDDRMDGAKVDKQIALVDLELSLDPSSYHGLWYRMHLMRRANRLAEADAAYRTLAERLPRGERLDPVVQERNVALLTERRFDDFERENRGISEKVLRWILEMRTAWDLEKTLRDQKDAQQLVLETTRGTVEVQLYRLAEEGYDALLRTWLTEAKLAERPPEWATGALGVAFGGMPAATRLPNLDPAPLAWRGTLVLLPDRSLVLATGPLHITRRATAIGRIVKGMEHVDAMTASDRIKSAKVVDGG